MNYEERKELQHQINDASSELIRLLVNAGISQNIVDSIDYDVSMAIDEVWSEAADNA